VTSRVNQQADLLSSLIIVMTIVCKLSYHCRALLLVGEEGGEGGGVGDSLFYVRGRFLLVLVVRLF
jgi:hypothetical protein